MPNDGDGRRGLGAAAKLVSERASSIVRLELAARGGRAQEEGLRVGLGVALLIGAAFFALFGVGFAFLTAAAALATVVSTWLALLIVTGAPVPARRRARSARDRQAPQGNAARSDAGDRRGETHDGSAEEWQTLSRTSAASSGRSASG